MKDPLFQKCITSIKKTVARGDKLLLAFSGGLDSMALLHLLLEVRRLHPFTLFCVHIDHGWRKESREEAEMLRQHVAALDIPFYSERIQEEIGDRNKEERYREKRYHLIQKIYTEVGANFLLTAHQADDQAETILKRVLEGASLFTLKGLLELRSLYGMQVFRPLLSCSRKELHEYLVKKGISYIDDPTNYETVYTRARMRHELIPFLEKCFGKGVKKNLCRLAEESRQLSESLTEEITRCIDAGYITWKAFDAFSPHQVLAAIHHLFPGYSAAEKATLHTLIREKRIGKRVRKATLTKEGVKIEDKF